MVKNPPADAGDIRDAGLIPGSGRSPGEGRGSPLQCSCLENPMDGGARKATVHRPARSWMRLKRLSPLLFSLWPSFADDILSFDLREFNFMQHCIQCPTSIFKGWFGFQGLGSSHTLSPRVPPSAVWLAQMESKSFSQNRDVTIACVTCRVFNEFFGF